MSRSWVRSKLEVTTWVQHSVDSHPFCSMSIGHPWTELRLFQNLTLKIKGQGHGWGHSSKSHCVWNILSTHIPLVPCQSGNPFLSYDFFKIWPWKSRSRSWVRSQFKVTMWVWHPIDSHPFHSMSIGSNILSNHIPFVPCQSGIPFLRCNIFKIWPWKSRVKVMGEVTVQSHNVGLASYRLTSLSFHVNRTSHSWDTTFSNFDFENPGSRWNDHDVAQLQV